MRSRKGKMWRRTRHFCLMVAKCHCYCGVSLVTHPAGHVDDSRTVYKQRTGHISGAL